MLIAALVAREKALTSAETARLARDIALRTEAGHEIIAG